MGAKSRFLKDDAEGSSSQTEEEVSDSESSESIVARFLPSEEDEQETQERVQGGVLSKERKARDKMDSISMEISTYTEEKRWDRVHQELINLIKLRDKTERMFSTVPTVFLSAICDLKADMEALETNKEEFSQLRRPQVQAFRSIKKMLADMDPSLIQMIDDYSKHPSEFDDEEEDEAEGGYLETPDESEDEFFRSDGLDLIRIYHFFGLEPESFKKEETQSLEERERNLRMVRESMKRLPLMPDKDVIEMLNGIFNASDSSETINLTMLDRLTAGLSQTLNRGLLVRIAMEIIQARLSELDYLNRTLSADSILQLLSLVDNIMRYLIEDILSEDKDKWLCTAKTAGAIGRGPRRMAPSEVLMRVGTYIMQLAEATERGLQTDAQKPELFVRHLSHQLVIYNQAETYTRYLAVVQGKEIIEELAEIPPENEEDKAANEGESNENANDPTAIIAGLSKDTVSPALVITEVTGRLAYIRMTMVYALYREEWDSFMSSYGKSCDQLLKPMFSTESEKGVITEFIKTSDDSDAKAEIVTREAEFVKPPVRPEKSITELPGFEPIEKPDGPATLSCQLFESVLSHLSGRGNRNRPNARFARMLPSEKVRLQSLLMHVTCLANAGDDRGAYNLARASEVQGFIHLADPRSQILYNRMLVSMGLSAFRYGWFDSARDALNEILGSPARTKELLGQRVPQIIAGRDANDQRNDSLVWVYSRALIPRHLHIPIDLLETISALSSILLESPHLASILAPSGQGASGVCPLMRRTEIGRTLMRLYGNMEKLMIFKGTEGVRNKMTAYLRVLLVGDWRSALEIIKDMEPMFNTYIPQLPAADPEKKSRSTWEMIVNHTRTTAMYCYLYTNRAVLGSLTVEEMALEFGLHPSQVLRSLCYLGEDIMLSIDREKRSVKFDQAPPRVDELLAVAMARFCPEASQADDENNDRNAVRNSQDQRSGNHTKPYGNQQTGKYRDRRDGQYRNPNRGPRQDGGYRDHGDRRKYDGPRRERDGRPRQPRPTQTKPQETEADTKPENVNVEQVQQQQPEVEQVPMNNEE